MRKVNIYEAKTRLSQLVAEAASGVDVVIARAGRPVARLTRLEKRARARSFGPLDGQFKIPDDFNRPLPARMLRAFEKG